MKVRARQRGQASLEFLVVSIVILFVLFFFLNLAAVFMVSTYVDYVGFMSGRAGQSSRLIASGQGDDTQEASAYAVLASYFLVSGNLNQNELSNTNNIFFDPIVKVEFGGPNGADVNEVNPVESAYTDPEQGLSGTLNNEPRNWRVLLRYSHLLSPLGFSIPGLRVDRAQTGTVQVYRREPTANECRNTLTHIFDQSFGGASDDYKGLILDDNGC
jgi:uncharacterized protein (UPF0333 family)